MLRYFAQSLFATSGIALASSVLVGCAPVAPKDLPIVDIEKALTVPEADFDTAGPPKYVKDDLLPPLTLDTMAFSGGEERFDVTVNQLPAREFFLGLFDGTSYNVVIHPSVQGSISLRLTDVTIPEVLDVVQQQYGYEYEETDYGYKILPYGLRTRLFHINYLNLTRLGQSETRVSSGEVTNAGNESNSAGSSSQTRNRSNQPENVSGTRIETQSDVDFWSELARTLQFIVGEGEGRLVSANPQSGVVIARAMPDELRAIESYLEKTQLSVQRQVLIEAKVLEVELKDEFKAGINWDKVVGNRDDRLIQSREGFDLQGIAKDLGGIISLQINTGSFDAMIDLLEGQGNVQVLSSPQVSTVNNQKAVIKVGTDEFFVTDISFEEQDSEGDSSESTDVTLTPFFSGIALDVTPQISEEDEIILHVHPTVSEVVDDEKTITIGDQDVTLPLAISTIRESDSVIRARSGQVVVIGGLIQNITKENLSSAPVLGDLPFVGSFFRQTDQKAVKSELVILLRPYIADQDAFHYAMTKSRERVKNMKRGYHVGGKVKRFGNLAEFDGY